MTGWHQLFRKPDHSGIYAADSGDRGNISKAAGKAGLAFFRLDATEVRSKQDFLKVTARILQFPKYFGSNWDAFEDCLTDLSWHQADGYVILLENLRSFADHNPAEFEMTRSIFHDATGYWKGQGIRFFVIMEGLDHLKSPVRTRPGN